MRVLLIQPSVGDVYKGTKLQKLIEREAPLNLAVLAACLLKAGHQVRLLDLGVEVDDRAAIETAVQSFDPELCGITFRTPLYPAAAEIAKQLKQLNPSIPVVAGGAHASFYAEEILRDTHFDLVVTGEGDFTIVELANQTSLDEIGDIAYRRNGEVVVNRIPKLEGKKSKGYVTDLDALPFPAYQLYEISRYRNVSSFMYRKQPVGWLETSRGCLAACVFCTKGVFGRTFRTKSPKRVVDEMAHLLDCGFREIAIADDSFTMEINRAIAICDQIVARGMKFSWNCANGLRVSNVTKEFFKKAAKAGCHLVAFGFETGSKEILTKIKKGATLEKAVAAAKWARECGLTTTGFFMLGLPGETVATMKETIDFACQLDLDYAKFNITIPLPGTELYHTWKDRMKVDNWLAYNFHLPARELYTHPNLDWDTIEQFERLAWQRFYLSPTHIFRRLYRSFPEGKLFTSARIALTTPW